MTAGVRIFRPEGRSESVYVTHCQGVDFGLQLAADCQTGLFAKKVTTVINGSVLGRQFFHRQGGYLKHLSGPFTITGRNDRGVDVHKTPLLEKAVYCKAQGVSHSCNGSEGVGSRA